MRARRRGPRSRDKPRQPHRLVPPGSQAGERHSVPSGPGSPPFVRAWRDAAKDPAFQQAQDSERDRPPSQGGNESTYLKAFLDARVAAMKTEEANADTSRVDDTQRVFLAAGNLDLDPPLVWKVYGDRYRIG